MDKCCWDIVKFLLFILNFAAVLFTGAVLGGALYVLFKSDEVFGFRIDPNLSPDNPSAIYFSFLLIVIVVFAFLLIFTFLGCCGAACQNRCMLGSFIIILFVFLGGTIGGMVFVFIHFPNEIQMINLELRKTIPYYDVTDDTSIVRQFWDFTQSNVECCGAASYKDWVAADGLKAGRKVPASCCLDDKGECVYQPGTTNAFLEGCVSRLELPLRGLFWGIPILMVLILISALIVCSKSGSRPRRPKRRNDDYVSNNQYSEETGYVYR